MLRISQISGRQMVKILSRVGFYFVSQQSSHIKLRRKINNMVQTVIVPDHKVIRKGTFCNILRMANLSLKGFKELMKKRKI